MPYEADLFQKWPVCKWDKTLSESVSSEDVEDWEGEGGGTCVDWLILLRSNTCNGISPDEAAAVQRETPNIQR